MFVVGVLAVTTALVVQITLPVGPWRATFPTDIQLLTNERAYRDPATPGVHISKDWVVTSGSLFSYQGAGWTGPIDGQTPDIDSAEATDSAVFRVVTRRRDFGNVRVRMQLKVEDMTATARTPRKDYDGVHVFLRYTSPNELYTVDLCRRDDTLTIKKKVPDSSAPDGGTYTTLAQVPYGCQHDRWASFAVEIQDTAAGVKFSLRSGSTTLMTAVDNGAGGTPPLYSAGRVGVRGDNTRFLFRDFTVASVGLTDGGPQVSGVCSEATRRLAKGLTHGHHPGRRALIPSSPLQLPPIGFWNVHRPHVRGHEKRSTRARYDLKDHRDGALA